MIYFYHFFLQTPPAVVSLPSSLFFFSVEMPLSLFELGHSNILQTKTLAIRLKSVLKKSLGWMSVFMNVSLTLLSSFCVPPARTSAVFRHIFDSKILWSVHYVQRIYL